MPTAVDSYTLLDVNQFVKELVIRSFRIIANGSRSLWLEKNFTSDCSSLNKFKIVIMYRYLKFDIDIDLPSKNVQYADIAIIDDTSNILNRFIAWWPYLN